MAGRRPRSRPTSSDAVASTVGLRELLTMATRRPVINGCVDSVRAVSIIAVTVGTWITPVWAYKASSAVLGEGAARPHRDDRARERHSAGDAGVLARVAERLGVDRDHLRRLVVLPELEQVVARHVGLVAERDEPRGGQLHVIRELQARRCRACPTGARSPRCRAGAVRRRAPLAGRCRRAARRSPCSPDR